MDSAMETVLNIPEISHNTERMDTFKQNTIWWANVIRLKISLLTFFETTSWFLYRFSTSFVYLLKYYNFNYFYYYFYYCLIVWVTKTPSNGENNYADNFFVIAHFESIIGQNSIYKRQWFKTKFTPPPPPKKKKKIQSNFATYDSTKINASLYRNRCNFGF